jgi:glycosyltransferase involved in cell wall biosynthesis
MKILFILKFRETGGGQSYSYHHFSSGLYWSAKFVADMLTRRGIKAKLVQVVDNNDIDREVAEFQPDIVVIEALWVVPEKFDILKQLHPQVKWIVRLHSDMPFLANEGIAIAWIRGYSDRGITIAVNDRRMLTDVDGIIETEVVYLPNFYPVRSRMHEIRCKDEDDILRVACFGAIRPLKNQLIQAVAAIRFAERIGKRLDFHINGTRVETGGNVVLENLRALFAGTEHDLIEHDWMHHGRFLEILRLMDIGMQVSLSETFSIVSADLVSVGVPIVVSPEVGWASVISKVRPTDSRDIVDGLERAYYIPGLNIAANRRSLKINGEKAVKEWKEFLQ